MPCEYCDADVDGGCRGAGTASDCLLIQLRDANEAAASAHAQHAAAEDCAEAAEADVSRLREALTQISSQYVTNRGDMTEAEALAAIKEIADRALLAEDGE